MHIATLPTTAQAGIVLAGLYFVYGLLTTLALWRRRQGIKRAQGAMEAPWYPQADKLFGLDVFRANMRGFKSHTFLDVTTRRFDEVGANTFQFKALGRHMHTTMEPENLKAIQATQFKSWNIGSRRKAGFRPLLGEGIFTTDGIQWQHSRDMLRPNFVRSQVGDLATFERHVSHLIDAIPSGQNVDLSDFFFRLTIDSATEFLFGESTESLTSASAVGFAEAFNNSQSYIANSSRWGRLAKLFSANKQFQADAKFVHDFVDYFVDKSLAKRGQLLSEKSDESAGRYVFINELVRQTTDRIRIRSEALNVLLAGRDTTASLLTNVWSTLGKRPDIWAKLQAEVALLDGEIPTFERLKDLKYLRAILNESLRLYPVVPINSREAIHDTTLPVGGGPDGRAPIFVKKGAVVSWNVYGMHRRKDYYGADAEEFNPERWLDSPETGKKGLRPSWEYLPFNGGARICLGQQFALTEASYTTLRLCQAFKEIRSWDQQPWTELLTLTCVNLHGAKVALTSRE